MKIQTRRLILRPWREEDFEPFAQLNADPRVMEYFPSPFSRKESDQTAERMKASIEEKGWGFWAVTVTGAADFIGFIGLRYLDDPKLPFSPAVEIGWRLAYEYWGNGYAPEGALSCLQYGFQTLKLPEIISFTAIQNTRSRTVMEKIGMHRNAEDDFNNPKLSEGHPLRRHVLYRLNEEEWTQVQSNKV